MLTEEEKKKSACALQAIITGDYDSFQASIQGISSEGLNTPVDKEGRTLLHYAASSRNGNFYGILVERGCVTNPKDAYGFTPEQAREKAGYARTQWYGADVNDPGVSRQLMTQAVQQSAKGNMYGALAILDLVRNDDANIQINEKGHGVLHLACIEGSDPSFTSSLMLKGCSLNIKDVDGNTPLHTAVTSVGRNALGNLDVLCDKALIADVNAKGPGGNTPLHIATERMDHQKVEHLLSRLSDISIANDAGETVCHIVAKQWPRRDVLPYIDKMQEAVSSNIEGNRECAEALIFPDKKGMSAVQYAIRRHIPEAEKIFEKAINIADKVYGSASPEVKSLFTCPNPEDASTLVHFVSSNGTPNFDPLAKRVLEEAYHRYGGEPFTNLDIAGNAPIHAAAQRSTVAVFEQLARYTPESVVNQLAPNGKAPIHMIVEDEPSHKGVSVKLQMLIENVRNIPSINVPSPVTGETPVVAAYKGGNTEDVKTMLRCNSMDVDAQSHDGKTIIHHAAKDGNLEILQQALGRKSSYSKFPVKDGVPTPGVYAIREASDGKKVSLPALDMLMSYEPHPQHVAVEAVRKGAADVLRHFITTEVISVNEEITTPEGKKTTLTAEALTNGQYAVVKTLIKNRADVNASPEPAISAGIQGGCFQGGKAIKHLKRVVEAGAHINTPPGSMSPLAAAVQSANEASNPKAANRIVNFLLQRGADLSSTDHSGTPALHLATAAGNHKTAKLLLDKGAPATQRDAYGKTALHIAAANGDGKLYKLIAKKCPDSCRPLSSHMGDTALHEALYSDKVTEKCFLKMLKESRKHLSDSSFKDLLNTPQEANGDTLLHLAASRGFGKACKVLLKAGASVSVVNVEGKTPVDVADPSLKARPWLFGKSVVTMMAERVQVPEGGFPPYLPPESPTPSLGSISSFDSVSVLSSLGSGLDTAGPEESIYEEIKDTAKGATGVESIYATVGAEGPRTPEGEDLYATVGAEGPRTPEGEDLYATVGAEGPRTPEGEDLYATVGAAITSEAQASDAASSKGERPESIYADPFDIVKPRQERPESIYADPFAAERTSSSGLTTFGPKEEPIYATVKKGPKKSDTSQKEGTASEKVRPTITVMKKKVKPQVPTRTSSLPTKEGIGSDKDLSSGTSSSFAAELQAQRGKLRPVKGGAPDSTKDKTATSVFSSEEFKKELTKAAAGLQGAVEAQKGDAGAAKAKQDPGMESGAPGSQPEAPQSEGPKPVKGGGRGR
uniref:AnkA n=3 Tax=Anaplasma phagocytophilum TaxID=948 RepID=Q9JRQ5_ANAPH|nr:ankyrin [Anaplasma phagocytophilum]ADA72255.1 AnkA [Anaplasma phagocytophilum str. Dog2]ADA72238.1 AnkA [Anaplasma phagocytophilum]ADA72250.1 AnkA [Anaplasma phagocytophilum]ADA72251.1 AnkA [Anaplasma phagocytophilum]